MQINPDHHRQILQKKDRILTGEYSLMVNEYPSGSASTRHPPFVRTDGVNLSIKYEYFPTDLSDSAILLIDAANAHALAHNALTPRLIEAIGEEFNRRSPLFRQAFNIAEDWRVESQFVDMMRISGKQFAALSVYLDSVCKRIGVPMTEAERFVVAIGRMYLSDPTLFGNKMIDYVNNIAVLAANDSVWQRGSKTIADLWRETEALSHGHNKFVFDKFVDVYGDLTGEHWVNMLAGLARDFHDKRYALSFVDDRYIPASAMFDLIERLMFLIPPTCLRTDGTNPVYDVWQDITFDFTESNDPEPDHDGRDEDDADGDGDGYGDGKGGGGDGDGEGDGEGDGGGGSNGDREGGDGRPGDKSGYYHQIGGGDACRCGTCGGHKNN